MLEIDVISAPAVSPYTSPSTSSPPTPTSAREAMERSATNTLASFHLQLPDTVASRPASCVRPPCLKSQATGVASSETTAARASPSLSLDSPNIPSPGGSFTYSFSAPRCMSFKHAIKRHVRFDSSPPAAFDTHSADDYDRSQIECTQGGSDFDLRLPSKCKRYNDGEEESDDEMDSEGGSIYGDDDEDDASSTASSSGRSTSRSPPFMPHGGTGWAFLRKGAVIGALHSPRPPACKPENDDTNVQHASLPVHGVRSFGGLARQDVDEEPLTHKAARNSLNDEGDVADNDAEVELERDNEAVLEAAAIASMHTKSPNATPKPSPKIIPRWARCTDYFQCTVEEHSEPSSAAMAPSLSSSSSSQESMRTATPGEVASSPRETASDLVEDSAATPLAPNTPISPVEEQGLRANADSTAETESDSAVRADATISAPSITLPATVDSPTAPVQEGSGRRPVIARAGPFGPSSSASTSAMHSPVHLSPSSSCDGSALASALSGMQFADACAAGRSASSDQVHMMSSPSPLSSRCSSIDPWSGLSSSGDEGTTGTDSPCAEWSSCTSPELTPARLGEVAAPKGAGAPATPASPPVGHDAADGDVVCVEGDRLPAGAESATPVASLTPVPTISPDSGEDEEAAAARHFFEGSNSRSSSSSNGATSDDGKTATRPRPRPRSRSSLLCDEERGTSERRRTSPPSTDDEVPRRRSASARPSSTPTSRRSSSSCSSSSMRSSSLCMSATPSSPSGSGTESPKRPSKSRSSSAGASGLGNCSGKVKKMPVWKRDEFEDEGALGGF